MLSFHQSILRREGLEPSRPSSFPDSPKWSVHTCILRLAGRLVVAEPDGLPAVRYLEILEIERGVAGRGAKPGERNHQWPERAAVRARRGLLPASFRRGLPRYPLPVLRLARLAVAVTAQQRGVGSALLRHVFLLALRMAEELGCVGILVDAKSDAVEWS